MSKDIIGGSCHKCNFCHVFVATRLLSRHVFCRRISLAGAASSIIFVTCLSRQSFCRDRTVFGHSGSRNDATSSGRWKSLHSSTPLQPPCPALHPLPPHPLSAVCNNHSVCGVTKAIVPTVWLLVAASFRSKRVGLMIEMLVCGACFFDPNGLLSRPFFSEANRAYRPSKRLVNIGARFFGCFHHRRQAPSLSFNPLTVQHGAPSF